MSKINTKTPVIPAVGFPLHLLCSGCLVDVPPDQSHLDNFSLETQPAPTGRGLSPETLQLQLLGAGCLTGADRPAATRGSQGLLLYWINLLVWLTELREILLSFTGLLVQYY